jgi:hypothetical protein
MKPWVKALISGTITIVFLLGALFLYVYMSGVPGYFDPTYVQFNAPEARTGDYACSAGDAGYRVPCSKSDYDQQIISFLRSPFFWFWAWLPLLLLLVMVYGVWIMVFHWKEFDPFSISEKNNGLDT